MKAKAESEGVSFNLRAACQEIERVQDYTGYAEPLRSSYERKMKVSAQQLVPHQPKNTRLDKEQEDLLSHLLVAHVLSDLPVGQSDVINWANALFRGGDEPALTRGWYYRSLPCTCHSSH